MNKKIFLPFELILHLFLLLKPLLYSVPSFIYFLTFLSLMVGRHFKQGNTLSIIFQILCALTLFFGDVLSSQILMYGGVFIAFVSWNICPAIYEFPQPSHKVKFEQKTGSFGKNELYWIEWVGIDEREPYQEYERNWATKAEVKKLCEHLSIEKSPFLFNLVSFLSSNIMKRKIKVAEGVEKKMKKELVLFSHGKTTTPRMYTFLQKQLAKEHKVLAPQHQEVYKFMNMEEHKMKEERQKEVKVRAKDIEVLAMDKVEDCQNIILVGHSYGCATVLQAYHQNHLLKSKVTKIILFDPWLYSLDSETFSAQIECPTLLLSNEYFVKNDDINSRNKLFISIHDSVISKCWKKADHAIQSDLLFILGNCFGKFHNAQLSEMMLKMNLEVMQMFLNGEEKQKIREKYREWDMSE